MGKKIAVTENGVHRIGKKLFLTDENQKHRKGKKAFLTVGGVHRLVFSSGVDWNKYSCEITTYVDDIYSEVTPSGATETFSVYFLTAYYAYEFDNKVGFNGGANEYINTVEQANSIDLIGMYYIPYGDEVWEIISVDEVSESYGGSLRLKFTARVVAQCEITGQEEYEGYLQGSTLYGTVEADEGALPEENGVHIDGDPTGDFCVLEIDGEYYYYVRGE